MNLSERLIEIIENSEDGLTLPEIQNQLAKGDEKFKVVANNRLIIDGLEQLEKNKKIKQVITPLDNTNQSSIRWHSK